MSTPLSGFTFHFVTQPECLASKLSFSGTNIWKSQSDKSGL